MTETMFSSSVLTATVILLRRVFRGRISRRLQYALWLPVVLRLLMPIPLLSSPVSVMNRVDFAVVEQAVDQMRVPVRPIVAYTPEEYSAEKDVPLTEVDDSELDIAARERASVPLADILNTIWICGVVLVGLWFIVANVLFYRKLRKQGMPYTAQRLTGCRLPVYKADCLPSPCLFGLFHPSIYLAPAATKDNSTVEHVITHELCHYAHGDHIWSLARGLCLALHWFNPLVWLAAAMSRTDCELACDEAAVQRLGEGSRISYGRTLVDMIAARSGPTTLLCAGTTMASGKHGIKERIDLIIKNPRPLVTPLVIALLMVTMAVGCTFTGAENTVEPPLPLSEVLPGANQGKTLEEKISSGLRNSNSLIREAWSKIQARIKSGEETSKEIFGSESTKFTDAEITSLKMIDSFDDIEKGFLIEVYRLRFRMLPKDPSKVMLAGGSTIKDGWLLSQGSMGDPYLVARSSGAEMTYLGTIYLEPGFGVANATLELMYRLEMKKDTSHVATSPIEIRRVFALDDGDLAPEEAAERLTLDFINSLREEEQDITKPQYKTFVVTDSRDIGFKMYPTADAPDEYQLSDDEISKLSWIVEPSASYRYKGTISPIGDGSAIPADQWVTELYQGSRVGFLMRKEGDRYTFRSRYPAPDGTR